MVENYNENETLLSFCIATYKKCDMVNKLVNQILKTPEVKIEVVVVDDCSEDGTFEVLSRIQDKRLRVYRNQKNLGTGGIPNWGMALSKGTGKWLFQLNDRDIVDPDAIGALVHFLEGMEKERVGFLCTQPEKRNGWQRFKRGEECLMRFSYYACHPTGIILNRKALYSLANWKKYFNYERFGMYPHGYLFTELAPDWDGIQFNGGIWRVERERLKESETNFWTGSKEETKGKLYCNPSLIIKNSRAEALHMEHQNLPLFLKRRIIAESYQRKLEWATFQFRRVCKDRYVMGHYGLQPVQLHPGDLYKILFQYWKRYRLFLRKRNITWYDRRTGFLLFCKTVMLGLRISWL